MRLTDICDFQGGSQPPKDEWLFEKQEGYIRMLQIRDFTQSEKVVPEYVKISKSTKICQADDILIARYGASIGKILTGLSGAYNVAIMRAIPDTHMLQKKYLYYYLKSPYFQTAILNVGSRAAQAGFNKEDLSKLEIKCPLLSEQDSIIDILQKVESIIGKRKKELIFLDELVKARFVEMFGDARKNPNKYDTVSFIDIVEYMGDIGSNGANKVVVDHLDMKDKEDYAMMVRFTNFTKNDFTDDVKYVSKEAYDFFKKSQIFGGELIICKIGSAGQNYVMPYLNRPVSLGLNQIMVRIKDNILMPYLYQYLHTDYGEFLISGCINGAVTKTITKTELKKIPVMLPPMELQREFVAFVEQVDKSKVAIKKSLDETQILFDSLMQKYFG